MTFIAAWVLFPAVLLVLTVGCGLLTERLSGISLPGVLLAPVGTAGIVVIAGFFTLADATAELATPATVVVALAGYAFGDRARLRRLDRWALAAAGAVFLVYGAPILLSGDPTLAGYIKLDDASTWMALTDHAMSHGRSHEGLAPSSHEAAVAIYLDSGYPLGSFLPWGVGRALVGQDLAWLFQPYEAFLAAMLALAGYSLVRQLVRRPALAAAAAFVGAQPALLYGYSLWGGVKEVMAAALIATVAAVAGWSLAEGPAAFRRPLALAAAGAATLTTLSVGGGAWLIAALAGTLLVLLLRARGARELVHPSAAFLIAGAVLALPALATAATFIKTASGLESSVDEPSDALGNLLRPLDAWQALGIWPAGDFRGPTVSGGVTAVLIVLALAAGALAMALAFRARAFGLMLYVATAAVGLAIVAAYGSPWVDAKGLATASPAFLLAAAGGTACLLERGLRAGRAQALAAAVLAGAVALGVLWSNVLAYHDATLAPYAQMRELQEIGERFAGDGPSMISEYQPYAARHLLRKLDAEGAPELRRRVIPTRSSRSGVSKGGFVDIDQFAPGALDPYRTLVLRRSPTASRPPSAFELRWSGEWYEVWQRRGGAGPPLEHMPLGTEVDPSGRPDCEDVQRLARRAGPAGRLATVFRSPVFAMATGALEHPPRWSDPAGAVLYPKSEGTARGTVEVTVRGTYDVWVGGSIHSRMEVRVDRLRVGALRGVLNNAGGYSRYGAVPLSPGGHTVELSYSGPGLAPGSAGDAYALGPLVLATQTAAGDVTYLDPAEAASLCGKALDWIEALPAASG